MSPCGRGCGSNPGQHGDIDKESERTGLDDDHDRDQTPGTNTGASGRTNGRQLPPEQARVARYRADGDAGLVHRLRGRPKALRRKAPELRAGVLARYDERCGDFGPTLAAEYLALDDTFKKAPESKKKQGRQTELGV
jgi:hypothetical protein